MRYFAFFLLLFSISAPAAAQSDFAKVDKRYNWVFPRDHGQHPEYQTEWWYFTGNLQTENGRRLGYELTFFRRALAPKILPRPSSWAFRDAYVAHFAITDIEQEKFYYTQKSARGALHLAGADSISLAVHIGDWLARQENPAVSNHITTSEKVHLKARSHFGWIDLWLTPAKPPVFHGDHGLLPNSSLPGDAVYYYSLTSLKTNGSLALGDDSTRVKGLSWMDHEFFTPLANSTAQGWDWLSLHLSDSTEVMLAHWRLADGSISPYATGTFIQRNGAIQNLTKRDFIFEPQSWWTSPATGGKYPVEWKIKFLDYELKLTTPVKNQELDTRRTTGQIYWEGYVEVIGGKNGQKISGKGYLEMTGYAR
jgi:predicted secreted hydrolase